MRHKKYLAILIGIFLMLAFIIGQGWASTVSVVATVDKIEATLEDYIVLQVSVKGSNEEPFLHEMTAFRVQSRGSSSQVRIVNGEMLSSKEYNYILYPRKTGNFIIGPFTIQHKRKTIESNRITIQIQKGKPQNQESRDIFVIAEVDEDHPYLYQEIIYKFKFFRKIKVTNARFTETPDFEGFIKENIGKEKEYQKVINGQSYLVTEIKQALFPTQTGVLEIAPYTLQCDVVVKKRRRRGGFFSDPFFDDSFFGFSETVPKTLQTSAITVMVKPLPVEGRPPEFKNLVGDFSLTSNLSKEKLEVGESITLTLILRGIGNLKSHQTIDINNLQNFKVYDDKPIFETQIQKGRFGGKVTIKKALVPLAEGNIKIPPITVSYFNPASGKYQTAKAGPYLLEVLPPTDIEKLQVVEAVKKTGMKEEVKILGKDILPIHTSIDILTPKKVNPGSLFTLICFLLPILGFLLTFTTKRIKERNKKDKSWVRSKNAYKQFKKTLPIIKNALKKEEPIFYQISSKALKDFIGDKLNIAGSALTSKELERILPELNVPEKIARSVTEVLDFFDSGQFGFKKHTFEEKEVVFKTIKKLVETLNKKI